MKENLLQIINHYSVLPQLKHFNSEVFELNEAIFRYEDTYYEPYTDYSVEPESYVSEEEQKKDLKQHIAEEIADCYVMLNQFQLYYGIENKQIEETMKFKIDRQLERINKEN